MSKRSWLRNVFAPPVTRPIRKAPPRARLFLEPLEDRVTPSTVGNYEMGSGQGKPDQVPPILTAGGPPRQRSRPSGGARTGVEVLHDADPPHGEAVRPL